MPFANRHNYKFKQKPSLFDCSFIASKTNKVFDFRAPVGDHYNVNGKYRRRCIQSHPSHCLQAAAGRRSVASVRSHARRASLDLINKYMRFYGHFVPTMQTHSLRLFRPSRTRWTLQTLLGSSVKTRTSRPRPPVFAVSEGGAGAKRRSSRQSLWGTNLL